MAEYQHTVTSAGEMTQRFIEFVLMQAQNAAFMLGQIPHPQTGKPEVNLEMAQLLIDQLVMIQEKTAGNLNSDESRILNGTLSNLQLAFVEAARNPGVDVGGTRPRVGVGGFRGASKPSGNGNKGRTGSGSPGRGIQEEICQKLRILTGTAKTRDW